MGAALGCAIPYLARAATPDLFPDVAIAIFPAAAILRGVGLGVGLAVAVGFVLSFGLALLVRRHRWLTGPVIGVSGVLYTIPSLALFAFLVPFTGIQNPVIRIQTFI